MVLFRKVLLPFFYQRDTNFLLDGIAAITDTKRREGAAAFREKEKTRLLFIRNFLSYFIEFYRMEC